MDLGKLPILGGLFRRGSSSPAGPRSWSGGGNIWVRRVEHWVLRIVSLALSLASAHAIRWLLSPLDRIDPLEPFITWMIAASLGALGYFMSRGLAHRIMSRESWYSYLPLILVVEFVEIFSNYALAAAVIAGATWLNTVSSVQRLVLTDMTYLALSVVPLVSALLAVVDVDLERGKTAATQPKASPNSPYDAGYAGTWQAHAWQDMTASSSSGSRQRQRQKSAGAGADGVNPTSGVAP